MPHKFEDHSVGMKFGSAVASGGNDWSKSRARIRFRLCMCSALSSMAGRSAARGSIFFVSMRCRFGMAFLADVPHSWRVGPNQQQTDKSSRFFMIFFWAPARIGHDHRFPHVVARTGPESNARPIFTNVQVKICAVPDDLFGHRAHSNLKVANPSLKPFRFHVLVSWELLLWIEENLVYPMWVLEIQKFQGLGAAQGIGSSKQQSKGFR